MCNLFTLLFSNIYEIATLGQAIPKCKLSNSIQDSTVWEQWLLSVKNTGKYG